MLSITKTITFHSAHMLTGHAGDCKNLHGHTYTLEVQVTSNHKEFDHPHPWLADNWVADFGDLKDLIMKKVHSRYDHAFIFPLNGITPLSGEIASLLSLNNLKILGIEAGETTVEMMAKDIWNRLKDPLICTGLTLKSVKLWETESSVATYWED